MGHALLARQPRLKNKISSTVQCMCMPMCGNKEKCFAWDCGESNIPWAWPSGKSSQKTSSFNFKELRMCQSRGNEEKWNMGLEIDDEDLVTYYLLFHDPSRILVGNTYIVHYVIRIILYIMHKIGLKNNNNGCVSLAGNVWVLLL